MNYKGKARKWHLILTFTIMVMTQMAFSSTNDEYIQKLETPIRSYFTSKDTIPAKSLPTYKLKIENPRFPGCEETQSSIKDKEKCAEEKLISFIVSNMKYPDDARNVKVKGTVIATFWINPDGSIDREKILYTPHPSFGEEALRLLKLFPKWIPAKRNGKEIEMKYTLPIKFDLGK